MLAADGRRGMPRHRIFQLGDVHYPDGIAEPRADLYDPGLSMHAVAAVASTTLEIVAEDLLRQLERTARPAIAICGDLTSRGVKQHYVDATQWLAAAFSLAALDPCDVHIVPGNHDVHRPDVPPAEPDPFAKFEYQLQAWQDAGVTAYAPRELRETVMANGAVRIVHYDVNSCILCGSYRNLEPRIITRALDELASRMSKQRFRATSKVLEDSLRAVAEQIDGPGIHEEHLRSLSAALDRNSDVSIAVVVAHHNLLPQYRTRLAIYPELINAGRTREIIVGAELPVLYLHGHVHDDPMETVADLSKPATPAIFIAAPELKDGYNIVDIVFAESGDLLGIEVRRARVRDEAIRHTDDVVTRVRACRSSAQRRSQVRDLLAHLTRDTELRFDDVMSAAHREDFPIRREGDVAQLLVEAYWMGDAMLSHDSAIHDHLEDQDPYTWMIRLV